jgi:hypothetical protein
MKWPEYEGKAKIPEGHYQFRLYKEPELKAFTYTSKDGIEKSGRKVVLYAIGLNETGSFSVIDNIIAWEERYRDLLDALHVEHGKDIDMEGAVFEADIIHEADKKDPTKSWPRIVNIRPCGDVPSAQGIADDIPF